MLPFLILLAALQGGVSPSRCGHTESVPGKVAVSGARLCTCAGESAFTIGNVTVTLDDEGMPSGVRPGVCFERIYIFPDHEEFQHGGHIEVIFDGSRPIVLLVGICDPSSCQDTLFGFASGGFADCDYHAAIIGSVDSYIEIGFCPQGLTSPGSGPYGLPPVRS